MHNFARPGAARDGAGRGQNGLPDRHLYEASRRYCHSQQAVVRECGCPVRCSITVKAKNAMPKRVSLNAVADESKWHTSDAVSASACFRLQPPGRRLRQEVLPAMTSPEVTKIARCPAAASSFSSLLPRFHSPASHFASTTSIRNLPRPSSTDLRTPSSHRDPLRSRLTV